MNIHELALLAAHVQKKICGADVALLVQVNNMEPEGWASSGKAGAVATETCMVRALQAKAEKGFAPSDYYVYTTTKPTVMCIGMGLRCHVTHFFYLEKGKLRYLTPASLDLVSRVPSTTLVNKSPGTWEPSWHDSTEAAIIQSKGTLFNAIDKDIVATIKIWYNELHRTPAAKWLHVAIEYKLDTFKGPAFKAMPSGQLAMGRPASALRDRIYMSLTFALMDEALKQAHRKFGGKNICCLLIGPNGKILSWGINTNDSNVTLHGEVNCIQDFFRKYKQLIPDNCTLYTTLQSCEMCSGMLVTVAKGLRVVYGTTDRGLNRTALQAGRNSCSEVRYAGPAGNPIARANFQRLVAKAVDGNLQKRASVAVKSVKENYPKINFTGVKDRGTHGKNYGLTKTASLKRVKNNFLERNPNPFESFMNDLPSAVTNALSKPHIRNTFSKYRKNFVEMGQNIHCVLEMAKFSKPLAQMSPPEAIEYVGIRDRVAFLRQSDPRLVNHATLEDFGAWAYGFVLLSSVENSAKEL